MTIERSEVEKALKAICIPILKELGFKGSFPNFYRDSAGFVSLVNFQFFSAGGSFCVNLSFADETRENVFHKKDAPAKELRVSSCRDQVRLGAPNLFGDRWFSFGPTSYGEVRGIPIAPEQLAAEVAELLVTQAAPWWTDKQRRA